MPLLAYTTSVSVDKTVAVVQARLVRAGVPGPVIE